MNFEKRQLSRVEVQDVSSLLIREFGSSKLTQDYLDWLYFRNPNGNAISYNAWFGEKLVAHYALIPQVQDKRHYLLSVNTCTDADFNGRGLFKQLARLSYERAIKDGFSTVVGIANKNSIFAFKNRLGFENPFSVRVWACSKYSLSRVFLANTKRNEQTWRLSNPLIQYYLFQIDTSTMLAFTKFKGIYVYLGNCDVEYLNDIDFTNIISLRKVPYVFITPLGGICPPQFSFKFPKFMMPSIWEVIELKLLESEYSGQIKFCGIDMDTF